MIINFTRNPYANGIQRSFQIQAGPLQLQGGNDRRIDENGYHHSNQVVAKTLGSEWSTMLSASTTREQPLDGLTWTRQWMA